MLEPSRTTIVQMSPRRTAPYQTLAPFSTVTSPIRVAVSATKASGWTRGRLPSNSTMITPAILPVAMPVTRRGSRAQSFSILANGEVIRSVWAPKSTVTP